MKALIAFLLPPLYFALVKRWDMCVLLSSILLFSFILPFMIAMPIILWIVSAAAALIDCRNRKLKSYVDGIYPEVPAARTPRKAIP